MAHHAQQKFFERVRERHPDFFTGGRILEVGSLDVNGSCRKLFFEPELYVGIDLGEGRGVDVVCDGADYDQLAGEWDVVCSGEMFEHNARWLETWHNMIRLCRPGGLVFFSCATEGRGVHGTHNRNKDASPFTNDYYENRVAEDFPTKDFEDFAWGVDLAHHDLYFWGVKRSS